MSLASHSDSMAEAGGTLPAFVERAKEDAYCRAQLARIGYSRVKATYTRQQRSSAKDADRLLGLGANLSPPMDLVRDWLQTERKRILVRVRWTFLGVMLGTIIAGMVFAAALAVFG
jgi:hypothetical protein